LFFPGILNRKAVEAELIRETYLILELKIKKLKNIDILDPKKINISVA
jgi:predicted RNA-binding protein